MLDAAYNRSQTVETDQGKAAGTEAAPIIEIDDLAKRFGSKEVLTGLRLSIRRGETICIIGESGTGKSVTLKHIVGLLRPDRGTVRIGGVDIFAADGQLQEIRKKIGFLFQGAALLNSMTVFDNVALPLREHERPPEAELRKRVLETLELVDMAEAADKMPAELSGGMKKRAGLARAIIRQPEIILYDEPTAGLDPVISSTINDLILNLQEKLGVTSIVVTHDMSSTFRVADRIAMLYQGKIYKSGTPDEFRKSEDPLIRQFIYGESEGPLRRDNH
ncbi:MAG: ABC transporter ATP-binding protein [Planctomycetes bacterium]|nr:ABC transporter ATP-binding protein [Planctomycetota bacterium]